MTIETLPPVDTEFTTLDLLLYRRFRREILGFVEKTLDLNPGLADLGPFLPMGTEVKIEVPVPVKARPVRILRLVN